MSVIHRRAARVVPGLLFASTLFGCVLGFGLWYERACESATAQALGSLDHDLAREGWSPPVRQIAAWAIRTNDHRGLPFIVIDQARGRLFAFEGQGRLVGSTPILRDPVNDEMAPAGRFVADTRRSAHGGVIVWANEHATLALDAAPPRPREHDPVAAGFHQHGWGRPLHVAGEFYRQYLRGFSRQASVAYVLSGDLGVPHGFGLYAARVESGSNAPRSRS